MNFIKLINNFDIHTACDTGTDLNTPPVLNSAANDCDTKLANYSTNINEYIDKLIIINNYMIYFCEFVYFIYNAMINSHNATIRGAATRISSLVRGSQGRTTAREAREAREARA